MKHHCTLTVFQISDFNTDTAGLWHSSLVVLKRHLPHFAVVKEFQPPQEPVTGPKKPKTC